MPTIIKQPALPGLQLRAYIDFETQTSTDFSAGGDGNYQVDAGPVGLVNMSAVSTANATSADMGITGGLVTVQGVSGTQFDIALSDLTAVGAYDQIVVLAEFSQSLASSGKHLDLLWRNSTNSYHAGIQRRHNGSTLTRYIDRKDAGTVDTPVQTVDATSFDCMGLRVFRNEVQPVYGAWADPFPTLSDLSEDARVPFEGAVGLAWPFNRGVGGDCIRIAFSQGAVSASVSKLVVLVAQGS